MTAIISSATPTTPAGLQGEARAKFVAAFKKVANEKALTPSLMLLRNLALGLPLTRGFTPLTNPIKLQNGQHPYGAFIASCARLHRVTVLARRSVALPQVYQDHPELLALLMTTALDSSAILAHNKTQA